MKQHREIIPLFYKKFKYIGDQCLSHCCCGWTINIDKKTYKKYKTAHQIEITDKHLIKYPKGSGTKKYFFIAFDKDDKCPFFGGDKFCEIYKTLEPSALSYTCQTYQRLKTQFDDYTQHSLSFSCSKVVSLVLFKPLFFSN